LLCIGALCCLSLCSAFRLSWPRKALHKFRSRVTRLLFPFRVLVMIISAAPSYGDPANGSFSIHIPVIMPPAVALTCLFSFMYDPPFTIWQVIGKEMPVVKSRFCWFGVPTLIFQFRMELWRTLRLALRSALDRNRSHSRHKRILHLHFWLCLSGCDRRTPTISTSQIFPMTLGATVPPRQWTAPNGFDGRVILQGNEGPIMARSIDRE